MLNHRKVIA